MHITLFWSFWLHYGWGNKGIVGNVACEPLEGGKAISFGCAGHEECPGSSSPHDGAGFSFSTAQPMFLGSWPSNHVLCNRFTGVMPDLIICLTFYWTQWEFEMLNISWIMSYVFSFILNSRYFNILNRSLLSSFGCRSAEVNVMIYFYII